MNVEIYESAKFPGGRCRSFYDKKTNIEIDNGNHLVFSANKYFKNLDELNNSLSLKELSMGMSADYYEAIKNNATFVRIGSLIFGNRG